MNYIRMSIALSIFATVVSVPADEFAFATVEAIPAQQAAKSFAKAAAWSAEADPFPAVYFPGRTAAAAKTTELGPIELGAYKGIAEARRLRIPATMNSDIVAFYGSPVSKSMGILGEYPMKDLARLLKAYAALYDKENGDRGVIPAFYIIYGTCWPEGEIGILKDRIVKEYIEYALANGILVFLDHQIGKYSVAESMDRLLPWLSYPNVHLALDPEWRTLLPMEELGQVTGAEINQAQEMMSDWIAERGIPANKMLVVHQFNYKMIQDRGEVRSNFDKVQLIHCADGFGTPECKKSSYNYNALAKNIPQKGFKLFFKTQVPGAGYDVPLLEPPEVMALDPKPVLVIYQ
jgi:hypothetical protein